MWEEEEKCLLSWPPRSSTAWTNRAWRVLVHRILGALMLLFVGSLGKINLDDLINPEEEASELEPTTPYCDDVEWWCNNG